MEKSKIQTQGLKLTALQRKGRKPNLKFIMLNAMHKSSANSRLGRKHRWTRSRRKPSYIVKKTRPDEMQLHSTGTVSNCGEETDEKEVVENKIRALQGIVPGGESLGVDKLFEQTAEYIMELQYQVKAMRALSSFFESFEKQISNCGAGG